MEDNGKITVKETFDKYETTLNEVISALNLLDVHGRNNLGTLFNCITALEEMQVDVKDIKHKYLETE